MYMYKLDDGVPIKIWSAKGSMDQGAIEQIENTSKLPFAFHHICMMPDGHGGYGAPIGSVLAAKGVVVPNFVGVDIGCGMCAVKTNICDYSKEDLTGIMSGIRIVVPIGFSHHDKAHEEWMPKSILDNDYISPNTVVFKELGSACKQIGTLGGGNHFIEIQKGDDGFIWIMIHSGSRNLGFKVANHYNKLAIEMNHKWKSSVPKNHELAFFPIDSLEGSMYLREMNYCLEFAQANREAMMTNVKEIVSARFFGVRYEEPINIHHNYAAMEHHFGKNVMVHRKGATSAREGQLGIIPGSQGTPSYIVRGKGERESFMSCSHGAGRRMGRKQAQRELSLSDEIKTLEDQGIVHSIRTEKDLDEAPSAYKNIDVVMEEQKDLVDIVVKLKPLAVIKG